MKCSEIDRKSNWRITAKNLDRKRPVKTEIRTAGVENMG